MPTAGWVLVAGDFTPFGGMDRANLALAQFLSDRVPLHLVTHCACQEVSSRPNVFVHKVPRPLGRHILGGPLLSKVGGYWAKQLGREGYRVVANGGNCPSRDVNWIHYVHSAYQAPATGRWAQRKKTDAHHALSCRAERVVVREARVVVCNSKKTANDVIERLGVKPERVRVVYLGIDPLRFPPITSTERDSVRAKFGWDCRPRVGFVGQLGNRVKGFDILYRAWRILCQNPLWDANLVVVGTGASLSEWSLRSAADGISDRMMFLGYRNDIPEVLAGLDALVHPARYEPFGMAAQEAVCRGLPVFVSSAAGVSELFPEDLSEFVLPDPEDYEDLADRLLVWRRDIDSSPARMTDLANSIRNYTWKDMASDFVHAVDESAC